MNDHDLELISFDICPYVERSRIALEHKGIDYEYTEIDLSDKPDWFLEISPRGKVPVLRVDDEPIFESNVINELIEELYPEPAMMPDTPLLCARARSWIVFANDELMGPSAKVYFNPDDDDKIDQACQRLDEMLAKVDRQLDRHDGPFFMGENFGLVDTVYAPLFNRWPLIEELADEDPLAGYANLRTYAETLVEHPSVEAGRDEDLLEKIRERY